jgi:hypothetical protein
MKKVTLFASLLALALCASAQSRQSVGATAVPSNAHGGEPPIAVRVNRIPPNVGSQSADAAAKPSADATKVPPTAKIPPTAVGTKTKK